MEQDFKHKLKDFTDTPPKEVWERISHDVASGSNTYFTQKIKLLRNLLIISSSITIALATLFIHEKLNSNNTILAQPKPVQQVSMNQVREETEKSLPASGPIAEEHLKIEENNPVLTTKRLAANADKKNQIPTSRQKQYPGSIDHDFPLIVNTTSRAAKAETKTQNQSFGFMDLYKKDEKPIDGILEIKEKLPLPKPYDGHLKQFSPFSYMGIRFHHYFSLNNQSKIDDYPNYTGVIKSKEFFSNSKGLEVNAGISSGHWLLESGLAFNSNSNNLKIHIRDFQDILNTRVVFDSVGFVFNAVDSIFVTDYVEKTDTYYTEKEKINIVNVNRHFNMLQVPVSIGFRYSFNRTSLIFKAGFKANLIFGSDLISQHVNEMPVELRSDRLQLFWTIKLQPELWWAINNELTFKTGLEYYSNLSSSYFSFGNLNKEGFYIYSGVNYWISRSNKP